MGELAGGEYERAMLLALQTARDGLEQGEQGIGAVVLDERGAVLAERHDEVESRGDPTAHAAILAIRDAARQMGTWRLLGASLVVTLEPCTLLARAPRLSARVARVVLGARDPGVGALGSRYHLGADPRLNHELVVVEGVLATSCEALRPGR